MTHERNPRRFGWCELVRESPSAGVQAHRFARIVSDCERSRWCCRIDFHRLRFTLIEDSGRSRGADHHPRQETPGSVPGVPACSGDVGEVAMPTVDLFVRRNVEASISKMSSALFG